MATEEAFGDTDQHAESTVLRARGDTSWISILSDVPGCFTIGLALYTILKQSLASEMWGSLLGMAVTAAAILALDRLKRSATVVIDSECVRLRSSMGWPITVGLDDIERLKIRTRSEWLRACVAIERTGGPKKFLSLAVRKKELTIPGDAAFQARVVDGILLRRPALPVSDEAVRFLAGKMAVGGIQRGALLIATGASVAASAYLLAASAVWLAPPIIQAFVIPAMVCAGAPFAWCLERESPGRSVVAFIGLGFPWLLFLGAGMGILSGSIEYMPLAYAAGLALALGGFVASLPVRLKDSHIAIATGTLAIALVAGAWFLYLGDAIPVRRVPVDLTPREVYHSPSGDVLAVECSDFAGRSELKFLNVRDMSGPGVVLDDTAFRKVLISDTQMLRAEWNPDDTQYRLLLVSADGQNLELGIRECVGALGPEAVSPDGKHFAFFSGPKKDGECSTLEVLNVESMELTSHHDGIVRGADRVAWREDGRLVWSTTSKKSDAPRPDSNNVGFKIHSLALGESTAACEFEYKDPCESVGFSPDFSAALLTEWHGGGRQCRVLALGGTPPFAVPAELSPDEPCQASWNVASSIIAYVAGRSSRLLVLVDIASRHSRIAFESAYGDISAVSVSPQGSHVAFVVGDEIRAWYVLSTETGLVRRIRPVMSFHVLAFRGASSWSPSGDSLAIASCDLLSRMPFFLPVSDADGPNRQAFWFVKVGE